MTAADRDTVDSKIKPNWQARKKGKKKEKKGPFLKRLAETQA